MPEYIDRDHYCKYICGCNGDKCEKTKCPIFTAPTADVAPVVHGEWERILCDEDAYEHHRCSICKEYAIFRYLDETVFDENSDGEMEECGTATVDIIEELTPFCPHCGAKMDGVRNNVK